MRRIIALVCAATMSFAVAGCNGGPDLGSFIKNVQNAAVVACGFLPAVETVAAIFSANSTLTAATVANAICTAVNPPNDHPTAQPSRVVVVGNQLIPVKGEFVRDDHATH